MSRTNTPSESGRNTPTNNNNNNNNGVRGLSPSLFDPKDPLPPDDVHRSYTLGFLGIGVVLCQLALLKRTEENPTFREQAKKVVQWMSNIFSIDIRKTIRGLLFLPNTFTHATTAEQLENVEEDSFSSTLSAKEMWNPNLMKSGKTQLAEDISFLAPRLIEAVKEVGESVLYVPVDTNWSTAMIGPSLKEHSGMQNTDILMKRFMHAFPTYPELDDSPITGLGQITQWGRQKVSIAFNVKDMLDATAGLGSPEEKELKIRIINSVRAKISYTSPCVGERPATRLVRIPVSFFNWLAWCPTNEIDLNQLREPSEACVGDSVLRFRAKQMYEGEPLENLYDSYDSTGLVSERISRARSQSAAQSVPPPAPSPSLAPVINVPPPQVTVKAETSPQLVEMMKALAEGFSTHFEEYQRQRSTTSDLSGAVKQWVTLQKDNIKHQGKSPTEFLRLELNKLHLPSLFHYLVRGVSVPAEGDGRPHRFIPMVPTTHCGNMLPIDLLYTLKRRFVVKPQANSKECKGFFLLEREEGLELDSLAFQLSLALLNKRLLFDALESRALLDQPDIIELIRGMDYSIQCLADKCFDLVRKHLAPELTSVKDGEDFSKNEFHRSLLLRINAPGNFYAAPNDIRDLIPSFNLGENRAAINSCTTIPLFFLKSTNDAPTRPPEPSEVKISTYEAPFLTGSPSQTEFMFRASSEAVNDFEAMVPGLKIHQARNSPPQSLARSDSSDSNYVSPASQRPAAPPPLATGVTSASQRPPLYASSQAALSSASPVPIRPGERGSGIVGSQSMMRGLASESGDCYLHFDKAVASAIARIPDKRYLTPEALLLMKKSTTAEERLDLISKQADVPRRDTPHDMVEVCKKFLQKTVLYNRPFESDPDRQYVLMSQVFSVVTENPSADTVIHGIFLFEPNAHPDEPGHWSVLLPRPGREVVDKKSLSPGAYWIDDDREPGLQPTWITTDFALPSDSNQIVAGFLVNKPLLGLGAEDKCSTCNKNAHAHSHSNLARSCSTCKKMFFGLCCLPEGARRTDAAVHSLLSTSLLTIGDPAFICPTCSPSARASAPRATRGGRVIAGREDGMQALGRAPPATPNVNATAVKNPPTSSATPPKVVPAAKSSTVVAQAPAKAPAGKKMYTNNPYAAGPSVRSNVTAPQVGQTPPQLRAAAPAFVSGAATAAAASSPPPYSAGINPRRAGHKPSVDDRTWKAAPSPASDPPGFPNPRVPTPGPGEHAGVILRPLKMEPKYLQQNPLHPDTVKSHLKLLSNLLEDFELNCKSDPRWETTPLPLVLEAFLRRRSKIRNWKPQSLHRNAASLHGAFANLPMYTNAPTPLHLGQTPMWKLVMSQLKGQANMAQPSGLAAATVEDINLAISSCHDLRTQAALILQWYLGARVGDILRLRVENVYLDSNNALTVRIDQGKVMTKRQPYTVHSYLPPEHANFLRTYVRQLMNTVSPDQAQPLFPLKGSNPTFVVPWVLQQQRMRTALRLASPTLNTRAIRRGSLQAMAMQGVPPETLMTFSGHTNVETLKRYLDYGRLLGTQIQSGQAAAKMALQNSSRH